MNTNPPSKPASTPLVGAGAVYAVLAYTAWGLLPIYWKFFGQIPPAEVVSHRIIWSLAFLGGILILQHRQKEFTQLWGDRKRLGVLLTTALLLAFNWGLYVYGVNSDRVIETSLGYFINPLVSVLLGFVFLKERLKLGQWLAVLLAAVGVANFIWNFGAVPWIALALAFSFALYGLLRKVAIVSPMVGLAMETLLVAPIAFVLVGYWATTGTSHFGMSWPITLLFVGAGVVTSMPLLWFNNAAKRMQLSTLGFFQYTAPSLQLILGVFLYREPFTSTHAVTFGCIWMALALYSFTALRSTRPIKEG